jgi:hypothetical protein
VIRGGVVVVGEVTSLEVEDALALVATDKRLITIVAQPLPATLLLLGRSQATEGAGRQPPAVQRRPLEGRGLPAVSAVLGVPA